jgi:ABC-type Zn uptake system ZnuABC Zn-binding protein ZnuA
MKKMRFVLLLGLVALAACQPLGQATQAGGAQTALKVVAAETFLADIAQNVAGDRVKIEVLMPIGVDPHGFEPTPTDVAKIADSSVLIVNGAGFEEFLAELLKNAGGQRAVIEAAAGLISRQRQEGEMADPDHGGDPHFWLDPNNVIRYVENIREAGKLIRRAQPRKPMPRRTSCLKTIAGSPIGQRSTGSRSEVATNHEASPIWHGFKSSAR